MIKTCIILLPLQEVGEGEEESAGLAGAADSMLALSTTASQHTAFTAGVTFDFFKNKELRY